MAGLGGWLAWVWFAGATSYLVFSDRIPARGLLRLASVFTALSMLILCTDTGYYVLPLIVLVLVLYRFRNHPQLQAQCCSLQEVLQ